MTSLNARVATVGPRGFRSMPVDDYFTGPGRDVLRENVLELGEILTAVTVPGVLAVERGRGTLAHRNSYLKAGEREAGDFALASAAVSLTLSGAAPESPQSGLIEDAGIALGGVAPTPYRSVEVEEDLKGRPISQVDPADEARLALRSAHPLAGNAYKVSLARNLLKRALIQLLSS